MAEMRRILWHLIGGTRGGLMRVRILALLRERPYNTNQVSTLLKIDYKTAEHHLRVLRENHIVVSSGPAYGAVFLLTPAMESCLPELDLIAQRMGFHAPTAPKEATDA